MSAPGERALGFEGLDLLACSVVVLDADDRVQFLNAAAENLFAMGSRYCVGEGVERLFGAGSEILEFVAQARLNAFSGKRTDLTLTLPQRDSLEVLATVSVPGEPPGVLLIELQEIDTRMRAARDERLLELAQENRDLLRNLAHEVKNPLGGIRGAAQLLELELGRGALREHAQIIVKEADRLQSLVDRLLAPHRHASQPTMVNIHEVCERVRSVLLAEFSNGLEIVRDYDTSLPDFHGDKERMIQVVLNLARNAAQALMGKGRIDLVTRVARQVTIARQRHKLALELHVIDNGPGIAEEIRERVFLPLVSGRDGGTGLGLTLAQTFVQQHGGMIECDTRPGRTDFCVLLPLTQSQASNA